MSSLNNQSEQHLIENNRPKIKAANEPKASGENISIDYSSIADKFINTYKDNVFVYHIYVDEFLNGYISKIMNPSLKSKLKQKEIFDDMIEHLEKVDLVVPGFSFYFISILPYENLCFLREIVTKLVINGPFKYQKIHFQLSNYR